MASSLYLNVHLNLEAGDTTYTAFVFGAAGTLVTVENNAGYSTSFTLNAEGFFSLELPEEVVMTGSGINNQGIRIQSAGEISAFLSSREFATTDLSIIFEESSLGTEYVLASYSQAGGTFAEGGQFSVQAIADGTVFTFELPDGQSATVSLDAGETYKFAARDGDAALSIVTDENFDITGTLISSNKDVAVFSGSGCTNILSGACDHIVEQMPAVEFLSTDYVLGEAFNVGNGDNAARVIAALDNTVVTVNGANVATLAAGEFYEFLVDDIAATVSTSRPALVAQYLSGAFTAGEGDPSMSFVPGTDTWLKEYAVATPAGDDAFAENLINVVIPTDAIASLTINGIAADPSLFTAIAGTELSVANIDIPAGIVRAEAAEEFQLSVFGYDFFDSYLTFGGASFASGIVNGPPNAVNDSYTVDAGEALTANVLDNDSDPEDDPLTLSLVDDVDNGSLSLNVDGSFTYISDDGFEGVDQFVYSVSDGQGGFDTATVTITVDDDEPPVDLPPEADDDTASTLVNTAVTIAVAANDSDPDGTIVDYALDSGPANGTVVLNPDDTFTYTPDAGFTGTDTFEYIVTDDDGLTDTATVTITVRPRPGGLFTPFDDVVNLNDSAVAINDNALAGDDSVVLSRFDDVLNGAGGNDTIRGRRGDDELRGSTGTDRLLGDVGNDTLNGGMQNDTLRGGVGDDILNGNDDNDVIFGGVGNDVISGGIGRDRIAFLSTDGVGYDIVNTFEDGVDKILLRGTSVTDIEDGAQGAIVRLDNGTDFLLRGISESQLSGSDFILQ